MTLNYKILGQYYFGPELGAPAYVPGSSSGYGYGYYNSQAPSAVDRTFAFQGSGNNIAYSDDAVTWKTLTLPSALPDYASTTYPIPMAGVPGRYVIIGKTSIMYSSDSINWKTTTSPITISASYGNTSSVFYDGKKFIASASNKIIYSTDGVNWSIASSLLGFQTIAYSGSLYVGFSSAQGGPSANTVITSTDGINWTQGVATSAGKYGLAYGNGKFVGTDNNYVYYSTDGSTWTQSSMGGGGLSGQVTFGNGVFVFTNQFGNNTSPSGGALYSTDGINWNSTNLSTSTLWTQVVYNGTKFVVADGYGKTVASSTDGINWGSTTAVNVGNTSNSSTVLGFAHINAAYVEVLTPQVAYTVPTGKTATITSIIAKNNDSVARTYDLAIVPSGQTYSLKHNIRWNMPVASNDFDLVNNKLTLGAGDSVYVFPSSPLYFGVTIFGVEIS